MERLSNYDYSRFPNQTINIMKKTHRHKYIADKWISYNNRLKFKRCQKNRASNIGLTDKDFLRSEKTDEEIETFIENK